jgi:hypothetical protein
MSENYDINKIRFISLQKLIEILTNPFPKFKFDEVKQICLYGKLNFIFNYNKTLLYIYIYLSRLFILYK